MTMKLTETEAIEILKHEAECHADINNKLEQNRQAAFEMAITALNSAICWKNLIFKTLNSIRSECWNEGVNMGGEYHGCWTRYKDIDRIIENHLKKMSESAEEEAISVDLQKN